MLMRSVTVMPSLAVVTLLKPARPSSSSNDPLLANENDVGLPPETEVPFRLSWNLLTGGVSPVDGVKVKLGATVPPFGAFGVLGVFAASTVSANVSFVVFL